MNISITERGLLPVRRDKQTGSSFTSMGGGGGGGVSSMGGGGGITAHSALSQLDYASSGHIGFAPSASPTFTDTVGFPSGGVWSSAGKLLVGDGVSSLNPAYDSITPLTDLHVVGESNITDSYGNLLIRTVTAYGANIGPQITFGARYRSTTGGGLATLAAIAGRKENATDGNTAGYLAFSTQPNATGIITERVRISSTGLVGINTIAGLSTLSINGGVHIGGDSDAGDNNLLVDGTCNIIGISTFTGLIKTVGGLHVGGTSDPGVDNLLVDGTIKGESLESVTAFSTGFAGNGYKVIETGGISSLEVDQLTVRGLLKAYELQINKISSVNGGMIISIANAKCTTVSGTTIYFDEGIGLTIPFVVDDYIKAQQFTGTGVAAYLGHVTAVNAGNVVATTIAGAPYNGMELVQFGNSSVATRQSAIYLTAAETNNPYIAGYTDITNGVFTGHEKFRLGNLTGVSDATLQPYGYGLYAQNVFLSGKIVASAGTIGGWIIDTDAIYNGTKHTGDGYAASTGDLTLSADGSIHGKYFYLNANGYSQIAGTEIPHLIKKAASDNLRHSIDAAINENTASFVKKNTIIFTNGLRGVIRVKYDLKSGAGTYAASAILKHNGTTIAGSDHSNATTSYTTKSVDVTATWLPGDTLEIWAQSQQAGTGAWTANFRVYYDDNPSVAVEITTSSP